MRTTGFAVLAFTAFGPAVVGAQEPSALAKQAPQQFDNITFVPPPGWQVYRADGLVHVWPANARNEEKLEVLLLPGRVSSGSLESELERLWSEVLAIAGAQPMMTVNRRAYDPEEPAQTLGGTPYVRGEGAMQRADGQWDVYAYAFRAGKHVERAAVVARTIRVNLDVTNAALNPEFARAIREMLFTMKFASAPANPPAVAGLRPGGIVGVWAGLGMSFGRIGGNVAIFFDNGTAYFATQFPARGLDRIVPAVEQPAQRRYWGTYTWAGGAGVLTMPYGTIPLRMVGNALELTTNRTPHKYNRRVMPQTPRLDGTWCLNESSCLRLGGDGRFQDSGAIRAVEHQTYPWPVAPPRGEGRYALRDYTLVLSYDDGQEVRVAFPGMEDASSAAPNTLLLGFRGDALTRRGVQ